MKELVGPYRIQSLLGHGGMGIVYLGVHDHLGREVAIKVLAPELTQHPQFRDRFFAEARVQAKLQHSNIVTIYDLIEDEGSYFIVMEYVPGPTLESLLKEGAAKDWELDHALQVFRQVLEGLDYAHSKGVIHRDVKSSNVLVTDGDRVKLTDFGIALLVGDKRLTASQSTIGTPIYMSPEQILRPRAVDHRSDVYSAAIVLYEILAGQPPFDAETEYEIKKLQIEAPVPDIRAFNPRVPDAVAEAITTALRKDPDERFPSAGAFLRALKTEVSQAVSLTVSQRTTPQRLTPLPVPVVRPTPADSTGPRDELPAPSNLPEPPRFLGVYIESARSKLLQGRNRWIALAAAGLIFLLGFGIAGMILSSGGDHEQAANASPPATPPVPVAEAPIALAAPEVSAPAPAASPVSAPAPAVKRLSNLARSPEAKPILPSKPKPKPRQTVSPPDDAAGGMPMVVPKDEPLRVGGAVSRPKLMSGPPPVYTEKARLARIEGKVVVKAVIDENGNVTNAEVTQGLPLGLDQAALEAVQNWKFSPATLQGQRVKVYYSVTINFKVSADPASP